MASIDDAKTDIAEVKEMAGRIILALLKIQADIDAVVAKAAETSKGSGRHDVGELNERLATAQRSINTANAQAALAQAMEKATEIIGKL